MAIEDPSSQPSKNAKGSKYLIEGCVIRFKVIEAEVTTVFSGTDDVSHDEMTIVNVGDWTRDRGGRGDSVTNHVFIFRNRSFDLTEGIYIGRHRRTLQPSRSLKKNVVFKKCPCPAPTPVFQTRKYIIDSIRAREKLALTAHSVRYRKWNPGT